MNNYFFKGLMAFVMLVFTQSSVAQAPQKMSYQAVIRDVSNAAVINTTVGMRISILQGSGSGTPVYVETQTPVSNAVGLVTIEVGTGSVVSGTFSSINWSTGLYWIKTETDPSGGTSYSIIGIAQLLSVPYAFYAGSTASIGGNWNISGNSGTGSSNFVGTIDDQPLIFKVNNVQAGRISSSDNTFFGYNSGISSTMIGLNAGFGYDALRSNTDGHNNVAVGSRSMLFNNNGNYNVAVGFESLYSNTSGHLNISIGSNSMRSNTTGIQNIAIGDEALKANTVGGGNIAIGHRTLKLADAEFNVGIGHNVLGVNTTGSDNTALGYFAMFDNTTGHYNTSLGSHSMQYNKMGSYNTGIGFWALQGNEDHYGNTALGAFSLLYSKGNLNTAVGGEALRNNVSGYENTSVGDRTLNTNVTGFYNTAIGALSDVVADGLNNATALGAEAKVTASNAVQLGNYAVTKVYAGVGTTATLITGGLQVTGGSLAAGKVLTSDASGIATWQTSPGSLGWSLSGNSGTVDGTHFIGTTDNVPINFKVAGERAGRIDRYGASLGNTFLGGSAGVSHSTTIGEFNSAFGRGALYYNVNGSSNTSVGVNSLFYNLGNGATAVGFEAMGAYANAETNVAIGFRALRGNVILFNNTGTQNTALGVNTLIDNSEGHNNTGSGFQALWRNSTGSGNTAMGSTALISNTTGSNNTAIGSGADISSGTLTNATALGANVIVNASNKVRIGNSAVTVIEGQVAYSFPSDARFKYDIRQNVPGLAFINKLNPVTYLFDEKKLDYYTKTGQLNDNTTGYITAGYKETSKIVHTGFLAQDIEKICKEMGYDFDGLHKPSNNKDHYSLAYSQFIMPLVKGMQEQQLQIEEQKQINRLQDEKLQLLQKQIAELMLLVEKLK